MQISDLTEVTDIKNGISPESHTIDEKITPAGAEREHPKTRPLPKGNIDRLSFQVPMEQKKVRGA